MTSNMFIILFVVFNLTAAFGQEKIWTKQTKIADVIAFERKIDSNAKFVLENIIITKAYYPLADKYVVGQPVIVQREPINYLPVNAEYFFTPSDSILRLVVYDWEKGSFDSFSDKQKIFRKESKKFNNYNEEYERIRNVLVTQLGIPTSTDTTAKIGSSFRGEYYTRKTIWESEKISAELKMVFESMTYRIRLKFYWKI